MSRSSNPHSVSALSSLVTPRRTDWFGDAPRDCGSVRAHLHEYVDEELDLHVPAERAILLAVANHVTHCTPCARVETQLRAMHLAVAAVGARMHVIGPTKRMSLPGELTLLQSVTVHGDARDDMARRSASADVARDEAHRRTAGRDELCQTNCAVGRHVTRPPWQSRGDRA